VHESPAERACPVTVKKNIFFSGLCLGAVLCCQSSCATVFVTETYDLEQGALGAGSLTIVLITDLHSTLYGEDQSPLIGAVREARPDLIFLAGDIIDDKQPPLGAELLLRGIRGLAPVFYVTGNHEYMADIAGIRLMLEEEGVVILSGRYERLRIRGNEILVAGIDDPEKKKREDLCYDQGETMERLFRPLDAMPGYKILIAHRPEYISAYRRYAFDLVVSGHAHGGQMRIPRLLPNGFYSPGQGFFPKYSGGLYRFERKEPAGEMILIVSRGLSVNRPRFPRINNKPELSVIRIGGFGDSP
jgi:predicted MPP superfamily phosphohydrolase